MARGRITIKSLVRGAEGGARRLEDVLVPIEQVAERVDFAAIFGDDRPVEVEIGSGKGGFLIEAAAARPEHDFLGIEWVEKFALYIADRVVRHDLDNVRVLQADAGHLFRFRVPAESISALHVYHPDPWPKKRHHKRRLFQPEFVTAAIRALRPGAMWYIQTDHAEYFEVMKATTLDRPELELVERVDGQVGEVTSMLPTNFAVRYGQGGASIYRLVLRRRCE